MKSMGKPSRNVIHGSFTHKNHHKNKFKATNKKMRKNNPVPLTSTINNTTNNNDINDTITAANNIQLRDGALNYNEWRYTIPGLDEKIVIRSKLNKDQVLEQLKLQKQSRFTIPDVPANANIFADIQRRASWAKAHANLELLGEKGFNVM
jgi:hypothetical protein